MDANLGVAEAASAEDLQEVSLQQNHCLVVRSTNIQLQQISSGLPAVTAMTVIPSINWPAGVSFTI